MSDCCCAEPICLGGKTYYANILRSPNGAVLRAEYVDENMQTQTLLPGSFLFGACAEANRPDVFDNVFALAAGNTVITHNLGSTTAEVDVLENAAGPSLGAKITHRVVGRAANTVTIFVPVAVPAARVLIDV